MKNSSYILAGAFTICCYAIRPAFINAQTPGSLDLTFSIDGKQTTTIGSLDSYGRSVAIQTDGKIIVAGYSDNGSDNDFALARYSTNGTLDVSFDSDGIVTTDLGSSVDNGYAVAIQSDGKIVVAGYSVVGGSYDFSLARYNTNGSLDVSFDSDGKVTTDVGSAFDQAFAMALQADGKILVAGSSYNGSDDDFAVVRYNTNGSLDTTFDSDGMLTMDFDSASNEVCFSILVQSDGKIVLGGRVQISTNPRDFALARFNPDGSLDNTFDSDGKQSSDFGGNDDIANSIALQADGKIVAAGSTFDGVAFNTDFALARYNTDGSPDMTFDVDGKVITDSTSYEAGNSAVIQADGKIVVAGEILNGSNDDFILARYNTDGSLDATFDTDGIVTTDFTGNTEDGYAVAIQPDLKIVVAGRASNGSNYDFAVARYISGLNLGLIDFSLDNSVLIYPNPIVQNSKLEYSLNNPEIISISLFDLQGKMIKTFLNNENQEAGNHSQVLAMPDDLAAGTYYLVVSTPNAKVSVKIIK